MPDWSGSMLAWWPWEGNGKNVNGICGAGCDLTNNGPMSFDTSSFVQGAQSVSPDGSATKYGSCSYRGGSNCSALNFAANASWTFGSAVRFTTALGRTEGFFDSEAAGSSGGYFGNIGPFSGTDGNWSCGWCGSWGCDRIDVTGLLGTTAGWAWVACRYVNGTTTVTDLVNGVARWTGSPGGGGETYAPSNGTVFTLPSSPNKSCDNGGPPYNLPCGMEADVDDAWVYAGALSDASICRICAAGVDGKAAGPNACDGASYRGCSTDGDCGSPSVVGACDTSSHLCQGRRAAKCSGCIMPTTCNQATP